MKKYIVFGVVGLLFASCSSGLKGQEKKESASGGTSTARTVVDKDNYKVNPNDVGAILKYLTSDELKGRDTGSKGLEAAATYIEQIFKNNNVKPYFETYHDTLSNFDKPTYNVVGLVEGNDEKLKSEYIVIGAHYDHIGIIKAVDGDSIANGANDNASGTTAVIEMAKYFGKTKANARSLIFVLFSGEEKGLLGSKHIAAKLHKENINLYAMVNFEMIGVPLVNKDYFAYVTGYEMTNMAEKFNEYAGEKLVGFLPTAKEYNLFKRSDNYAFYKEFGVPSQTFCTFDFTNFEHYHKVGDEFELMGVEHMSEFIIKFIPVMEKMANATSKEIVNK